MTQRGMTLVELLIVIAIAGILLGIGVPSYGYLVNNSRLVGLTNSLVRALNLARSEAITRNQRVTVCKSSNADSAKPVCDPTAGWQQGWLIFVDQGSAGILDDSDQIIIAHAHPPVEAAVSTSNFSTYASYLPSGVSQGPNHLPNGSFHFCLAGEKHSVILNIAGRIRTAQATC